MQKNKTINNFKDIVFNSYLKTTLKKYGIKTNNRILLKYIESSKFDIKITEYLVDNLSVLKSVDGNYYSLIVELFIHNVLYFFYGDRNLLFA